MVLVHTSSQKHGLGLAGALVFAALLVGLALSLGASSASAAACPSFRVLHDDRIGPAVLPAGNYTVTTAPASGLTCPATSKLFTRFLEDYDGVLPSPWRVNAQGSGKASFTRAGKAGFSVARSSGGGEGGGGNELGALCKNPFTVNSNVVLGPVTFAKGQYLLYLPPRSGISCNRAAVLFTRFLGSPEGRLPFPWRLQNQTATFFKPEHPARSAFRVEPAGGGNAGAGPA
ncbi:MAG: hypothetical protein WA862_12875 [Solirubrobacterales bacterium]